MSSDDTPRVEAQVALDTVTAFQDRAQLHYRTVQPLELEPGTHVVVFRAAAGTRAGQSSDKIWSEMDASSLQVRLLAGEAEAEAEARSGAAAGSRVMLRDVGQITRTVEEPVTEEVQQKRSALVSIREAIARLELEQKILQGSRSYVEKLRTRLTAVPAEGGEAAPGVHDASRAFLLNPTAWSSLSQFLSSTTKRCERKALELEEELKEQRRKEREIETELRGLREDVESHLYYRCRTDTTVEATVEVLPGAQGRESVGLVLSFVAPGVSWNPAYDVRVDREQQTMEISYYAKVSQRTGVAWDDVCLRLSTAKPSLGASPPWDDGRWEITIQPPPPPPHLMREHCKKKTLSSGGAAAGMFGAVNLMAAMPQAAEMHFEAAVVEEPEAAMMADMADGPIAKRAAVESGGSSATASTFTIAGRVSVPTGDREVRVCIMVEKLPVKMRFTCTPKLDPTVYLSAVAANTTPFELLSGPANVFFNQTFVCTATLPAVVADGGEIKIALGADESVKVKRQRVERRTGDIQRASLFSSAKRASVHYSYLFEVTPELPGSEIRVMDQYPVATHKEMGVTLEEPAVPKGSSGKDGVVKNARLREGLEVSIDDLHQVTWVVRDAKPHETQRFRLVFVVDYPAEQTPTGIDN